MGDDALASLFGVEIYGALRGGYFDKISGITSEIEGILHWVTSEENESIFQEKIPGRVMSGEITLTGTVTENQGFWQWHRDIAEGKDRRVNCSIVAFDESKNEVARWDIEMAWPRKITITEMSAESNGLLQQEIILAHSGFTRVDPATS